MLMCTDFLRPHCFTVTALVYLIFCTSVCLGVFYLVVLVILIYNFILETVGIFRHLAGTTSDLEKLPG